jgi:hypothetical protein
MKYTVLKYLHHFTKLVVFIIIFAFSYEDASSNDFLKTVESDEELSCPDEGNVFGCISDLKKKFNPDSTASVKKDPEIKNSTGEATPPPESPAPPIDGQKGFNLDASKNNNAGIDQLTDDKTANELAQQRAENARRQAAKSGVKIVQEKAASGTPVSPPDQKKLAKAVIATKKEEPFSWDEASATEDPDLRKRLKFISASYEVKKDYQKEHTQLLATIAQLSQMALTTAQRAQNLGAVDPKSAPAMSTKTASASNPNASRIAETKPAISDKSNPGELTAAEVDQDSSLTEEQKTKLKTAIEAAAKRKQLMALKQRLKNKLNPQTAKKDLETEEATSAFNLDLIPDEPQRSLASANPEKEKEDFLNSAVFHAMQAQFSMDGGQTRAEVERMLDEVEKELGSTGDILAGILGTDSKSLFERIREAHLQCVRQNCVFTIWKNRVP